jgi:hypothetical protein
MHAKISEVTLNALISPTHFRWPAANASPMWARLHETVRKIKDLVAAADKEICDLEIARSKKLDPTLSDLGHVQKIGQVGIKFIEQLTTNDVVGLARAEKAVNDYVTKEKNAVPQITLKIGTPGSDEPLASEIRAYCKTQTKCSPGLWATMNRSDPRVFAAIANAPAFLSGLTAAEHKEFISSAHNALTPAAAREAQKALDDVRASVAKAERTIATRAQAGLLKTATGYVVKGTPTEKKPERKRYA